MAERKGFEPLRQFPDDRISSAARYDHFDISPKSSGQNKPNVCNIQHFGNFGNFYCEFFENNLKSAAKQWVIADEDEGKRFENRLKELIF